MSRTRQVGLCLGCNGKLTPGEKVLGLAFCSTCTNPTVEEAKARPEPQPSLAELLADLGSVALILLAVVAAIIIGGGA